MTSAGGEVAAVIEHQAAVAKPDSPPPRRFHNVMLSDLHALSRIASRFPVLH